MHIRQFPFLVTAGAACLLLTACGSDAGQESAKATPDAERASGTPGAVQESKAATDFVPCTLTVLDIREGDEVHGGKLSYVVRYRVHVPGRPDHEGTEEPVLNPIQVAQIVAVSKDYPCEVSRSDPEQIRIDWDEPLTASPSPAPR